MMLSSTPLKRGVKEAGLRYSGAIEKEPDCKIACAQGGIAIAWYLLVFILSRSIVSSSQNTYSNSSAQGFEHL